MHVYAWGYDIYFFRLKLGKKIINGVVPYIFIPHQDQKFTFSKCRFTTLYDETCVVGLGPSTSVLVLACT